jgi:hypothetical protein
MCPVSVIAKPNKGKAVTGNRVEVQEARTNLAANDNCERNVQCCSLNVSRHRQQDTTLEDLLKSFSKI